MSTLYRNLGYGNTQRSYAGIVSFLNGKTTRKIGNNTYVRKVYNDVCALQYHATDVVQYYENGTIKLNSNGWQTLTTKERINAGLYNVATLYQKSYTWYVVYENTVYRYEDGMIIDTVHHTVSTEKITDKKFWFN